MLEKEVLKTLSFYSIFEFPLTPFEIYKNLSVKANIDDVYAVLENLESQQKVKIEDGYYFLASQTGGAEIRKARFLLSFKKMKQAKRIATIFSYFPFVKFVGVCNSLGYLNAREGSDIDFVIIAEDGRLWLTRFLCASFLKILNLRPTDKNSKDKICLSFLLSKSNLNIAHVALQEGDPYLEYWMGWIMPLYDDGIYKKFVEENTWIKKCLPNSIEQGNSATKPFTLFRHPKLRFGELWKRRFSYAFHNAPVFHKIIFKWLGVFIKRVSEIYLGDWCEEELKNFQNYVMPKTLKEAAKNKNTNVIIKDEMLKFHLLDRRKEYKNQFYEKIKEFSN